MNPLCIPVRPQVSLGDHCEKPPLWRTARGREFCRTQKNRATKRGRFAELDSNYLQSNPDAAFYLTPPSGITFTCQGNTGCGQQWEIVSPVNIDEGLALDIAEDSVQFYFFPEMSQWAAQFQLYCDLERDSLLRASNAVLNSFYQTQRYQALGLLRTVEQKISLLSDSSSRADSLLYVQRLQEAKAANQLVNSNEEYVLNEKWANEMHLKVIEFGHDTLSTEEIEQIHDLAHSCPAVNGLGVYLARYLNAFYEPLADYNDYLLCNAAAKGGNNLFDFVGRFLSDPAGYQDSPSIVASDFQQILVFPVPASETLCFQSEQIREQPLTVFLYDVSGQEVCRREWLPDEQQCRMNVSRLTTGLYFYSAISQGEVYYGKVLVQH